MKRTDINEAQMKFIEKQFRELSIFTSDLLEDYGAWPKGGEPTEGYNEYLRLYFEAEEVFFKELNRLIGE